MVCGSVAPTSHPCGALQLHPPSLLQARAHLWGLSEAEGKFSFSWKSPRWHGCLHQERNRTVSVKVWAGMNSSAESEQEKQDLDSDIRTRYGREAVGPAETVGSGRVRLASWAAGSPPVFLCQ